MPIIGCARMPAWSEALLAKNGAASATHQSHGTCRLPRVSCGQVNSGGEARMRWNLTATEMRSAVHQSRNWRPASRLFYALSVIALLLAPALRAQVTGGKKPELPPPFASKSVNNAAEEAKPPKGFLPNVPQGFKINVFAADFKGPRWMALAPNDDVFLADTAAGNIVVLRDPQ